MGPSRAIFLDRDGTLIVDAGYPKDPELVRLLRGAADALRRLQEAGFRLIVVSNQSGVGRGLVTPEQAHLVHEQFLACLESEGVRFDGVYYCPHAPEAGCRCRKPSPGMIHQAAAEHGLDLTASFLVGDKPSDVEAGANAGCRGFLFRGDWAEALRWIEEQTGVADQDKSARKNQSHGGA